MSGGAVLVSELSVDADAALRGIAEMHRVRGRQNETVVRHALTQALSDIYPVATRPWWVRQQIHGAERITRWIEDGERKRGSADTIIGATAVEFESDLTKPVKYNTGRHQVRQYCAALLNDGVPPTDVRGVLSDGVDWYGYQLINVVPRNTGDYAVEDFELEELGHLATRDGDPQSAEELLAFFSTYFARDEKAPLTGADLAAHLGLGSGLGADYLIRCEEVTEVATTAAPAQAALVDHVWEAFERYLSGGNPTQPQRAETYVREFYLSVLAKLVCANIVASRALHSDDSELASILRGEFFDDRGLMRLVEHDFFGWLVSDQNLPAVVGLARSIQADLRSYNFSRLDDADVFGSLMSELADATQRQLLGQQWTPAWLADAMAARLVELLPDGDWPRFVDICVGSGAMVAAVCKQMHALMQAANIQPGDPRAIELLGRAVTGFDIDPLAALLAKVNWVAVNRDWLTLDGSQPVSVPIYNADSLFALAPVWDSRDPAATSDTLLLDDAEVDLPRFLIEPDGQRLFDGIIDRCTSMAMAAAGSTTADYTNQQALDLAVEDAVLEAAASLSQPQLAELAGFARSLTDTLTDLERADRDRIWSFVLRNSFRPALVAGRFNGLITNPPWLAMSRLSSNPFAPVLSELAARFDLRPVGPALPHLEMATVFLTHAVDHYLTQDAVIGCVLPETVTTGSQHESFRRQLSGGLPGTSVAICPTEVWLVDRSTFSTPAMVLFGKKRTPNAVQTLTAISVDARTRASGTLYVRESHGRFVWSAQAPGDGVAGGYPEGHVKQGADLMPRRLVAVRVTGATPGTVTFQAPQVGDPEWYLYKGAHEHTEYWIPRTTLPSRFRHTMWISTHLVPFRIADPADMIIPAVRTGGILNLVDAASLAASPRADRYFQAIVGERRKSLQEFWKRGLNARNKLSGQDLIQSSDGYLVMYGAGGQVPTAAYVHLGAIAGDRPIVDQTLYWTIVETEDEAAYMCGVINSPRLAEYVRPLLPEGAFGGRHIHTLPPKATPRYDPADPDHQDVARKTRILIGELDVAMASPAKGALLNPNGSLQHRRSRVRELIADLPSYPDYDGAVRKLYSAP